MNFPPFYFIQIQLIKMKSLSKLNVLQLYRKLPLIVFKETYLLPQYPSLPSKLLNLQTLTSLKQITNIGKSKSNLKLNHIPSVSLQQLANCTQEIKNFVSNYLALTNQPNKDLICLKRFAQENTDYITEKMNGKKLITKKDLLKIFKSCPVAARADYQRRAHEDFQIEMEIFNQFQQLHRIPSLQIDSPKQIYNKLMENQQKKNYPKFHHLTKKQKQIYNTAYLIVSHQFKIKFQKFLKSFNITKEELDIILQICTKKKEYTESILNIKSNMSRIKSSGIESELASEHLGEHIQKAANLFKIAQKFPEEKLNQYERFFDKAIKKEFKLPPLVDWSYQKSERKYFDIPKAAITIQEDSSKSVTHDTIKQPVNEASASHGPLKQVQKNLEAEPIPLQKPAFPPKSDIQTRSPSAQISTKSETIIDSNKANEANKEAKFVKPHSNQRKHQISAEQDSEYESLDDQQPKHRFRSPHDELYDLDEVDDNQALQIIKNYDKARRKIISKFDK